MLATELASYIDEEKKENSNENDTEEQRLTVTSFNVTVTQFI